MAFKLGNRAHFSITITEKMVEQFAEVSGDRNLVHMDEEYAKTTRFGRRIAHGMLSAALISKTLATELGDGGIYLAQTLKFIKPIFIGDTVTVQIHVTQVREEKGIGIVETLVRNQNEEICVKGEATIMNSESVQRRAASP